MGCKRVWFQGDKDNKYTGTFLHFHIQTYLLAYESSEHSFCFYDPG